MGELNGILNVNKPKGISSARAVSIVKRLLPRGTKIGHAGTLDTFATGVLLLLIGKATKQCETLMSQPKQYEATVRFGATTATDDPESPPIPFPGAVLPTSEALFEVIPSFIGTVQQRPPAYSALKIGGRRASDRVRDGETIALTPRTVRIDSIELLDYAMPDIRIRVDCGRGTYIRALARDLGERLSCGGHLVELCRTRIGNHSLTTAAQLDGLTDVSIRAQLTSQ